MTPLTDDEIRRIRQFIQDEGLLNFVPYADQAAAEAKLNAARRLVWKTYRQMFITSIGLTVAVATFWEKTIHSAGAFLNWLMGQ